eukprot:4209521-Pleurochrysis_carterae.AAC.2
MYCVVVRSQAIVACDVAHDVCPRFRCVSRALREQPQYFHPAVIETRVQQLCYHLRSAGLLAIAMRNDRR